MKTTEDDLKKWTHPQRSANILSRIFFCWTAPSLLKGFRTQFTEEDLFPPLEEHESSVLGDRMEAAWEAECAKEEPSLWRPIRRVFFKEFLLIGGLVFINEFLIKLSQPILLWQLMMAHNVSSEDNLAYIYAFLIVLSCFINPILFHWCYFSLQNLGMKVRIACGSLIYRKSLKLSKDTMSKTTNGQIVNLLSNDLNRFDKLLIQVHYLWAAPLETLIILYLLYVVLGPYSTIGVLLCIFFIPLQIYIGKKYSQYRGGTALKTDERVRLIDEIISGIQVIKMHTWEKLFQESANTARDREIRYIRATSYLKAFQTCFNKYLSRAAIFICIITYVLTGNILSARYIFVLRAFYSLLKDGITTNFPEAIKNIAEALVSVSRVEAFLRCEEVQARPPRPHQVQQVGVVLENVSAQSLPLSGINLVVGAGQLVALVGAVGSGKSSLIRVILREGAIGHGHVRVTGKVSYAAQVPWLFAGTIRDNILFGQKMNECRYQQVVRVCALERDFDLLSHGDGSMVGDRGVTLSGGQKARINLARALYRDADIYLLDDPLSALDASVSKQIFNDCFLHYLRDKCVVLATHQLQYLQSMDVIYVVKEGKIGTWGTYDQLRNLGEDFGDDTECAELQVFDYDSSPSQSFKSEDEKVRTLESKGHGAIPSKIYWEYILSGGWFSTLSILVFLIVAQGLQSGAEYFEAYWVNMAQIASKSGESLNFLHWGPNGSIYFYALLMGLILMFTTLTSVWFYAHFMTASIKLHNRMFSSVIHAGISFFHTNPTGTILNRFSKDVGALDMNLPKCLMDTVQIGLNGFAIAIIIAIVNPWMALIALFMCTLFYLCRRVYLSTSRELKRIEATSRSPVFSHLAETLQGLETIRAFNAQAPLRKQFDERQNENVSAFYMFIACSCTFTFWLDMFCVCYIAAVTASCFLGKGSYGSEMGLIITQAMGLTTMLEYGMKQWSEFENEMTSVERIVQFIDIEPEEESEVLEEVEAWPLECAIEFDSVHLKYKKDIPAALNDLSFQVQPKEKVGIVGRTGAGKSSIMTALFRLADFDGSILIDGRNIKNLPLAKVRSRISIIPQEPVLFSGTIRENLDPFLQFHDQQLWSILEELDLKEYVSKLSQGLESRIRERGSNLSVGQRQLFCLARTLLRDNKILVLDEATASVDLKTDSLIQSTIKRKFVDCTVLVIAHRLHTIMDCDRVLVMEAGAAMEFDHPHKLLRDEDGALFELVTKTGPAMASKLKAIAKENYQMRFTTPM